MSEGSRVSSRRRRVTGGVQVIKFGYEVLNVGVELTQALARGGRSGGFLAAASISADESGI